MALVAAATGFCWPNISSNCQLDQAKLPLFIFSSGRTSAIRQHRWNRRVPRNVFLVRSSDSSGDRTPLIEEQAQADPNILKERMQALADAMELPANFLGQLPNDLRNDLKDAAFSLSNGPVQRECGELAGLKLLQLASALEKADTQAVGLVAKELEYVLPGEDTARAAIGKRLIGAGRHFAGTGVYANGELQKIAKAFVAAGEILNVADAYSPEEQPLMSSKRTYKFGDLQVELTAQKCYVGCIFALGFGALSWELATALQNIPEGTLQFGNDNATLLAKSLRGTLLTLGYGCTILSAFTLIGLLGLGVQLSIGGSTKD